MTRTDRLIEEGFVNVSEARKYLGICKSSMYDLINSNTISHAIFRGRKVVPVKALREYAASRVRLGTVA